MCVVAPPKFIERPPPSRLIYLRQTITLRCFATGYNVSYQWTIGSGLFPDKVTGINSNTLMIPDVRSSDDNTYACVASNEGGSVSSSSNLTVIGMTTTTYVVKYTVMAYIHLYCDLHNTQVYQQ